MVLSPAYDLVNTALINPAKDEEITKTLNKKKKLIKQYFVAAMNKLKMEEKQQQYIFNKIKKPRPIWMQLIDNGFLSNAFKNLYKTILNKKFNALQVCK